jgi:intein/homing endonuclease
MRTFGRYAFNKCLSVDNKVKDSITGEEITIGELRDKTNFHLLSLGENELFHDAVEEVIDCGNQDVYEIMLDNGIKMEVTMNHKFLCTDGQYKTVREIIENGYEIREANNI